MTFKQQFPEFTDIDDEFIGILLSRASALIDSSVYASNYSLATFLIVAHDLELGRNKYLEFQSQVAAICKGDLIPSFTARFEDAEYWSLTTYGMQLKKIKHQTNRTGFTF
jgi:hypothetical protein